MQVVIVDEFTGRTLPGRRWGDGLHQAIEAKEGLDIQNETTTEASISYQVSRTAYSCMPALPLVSLHKTGWQPRKSSLL